MKDIVIGAVTNYSWDKIKFWVNSLEASGFDGLKVMICYNLDYGVVEELTKRGFTVFGFKQNEAEHRLEYSNPNFNICLDRFSHIWYFLNNLENKEQYRYVISTDVRDVIFQTNPSTWLEENMLDKEINVGSECIKFGDEEWNKNNMYLSFGPLIADNMKDKLVYNAGAIAGKFQSFIDFCNNIFLSSGGAPQHVPGGGGPDQAAMNVLLSMKPYSDITNFAKSEEGWAAQLAVMGDPRKFDTMSKFITEPFCDIKDGTVYTSNGKVYSIVHQYDRNPELTKAIEEKYA
jgi:hypothetical protein